MTGAKAVINDNHWDGSFESFKQVQIRIETAQALVLALITRVSDRKPVPAGKMINYDIPAMSRTFYPSLAR